MSDNFVMAILPYAVMVGIAVSAIASIALVVSAFLKTQRLDAQILPRLAEVSASIERASVRRDEQADAASAGLTTTEAQVSAADLYEIAQELKGNANAVHQLLDQIESDARLPSDNADRGRILDLGRAVSRAESNIAAVVRKIEIQRSEPLSARSARALNEG